MEIQAGKKYLDRKGRVWGPATPAGDLSKPEAWFWREQQYTFRLEMVDGHITMCAGFRSDGTRSQYRADEDLVSEVIG